MTSATKSGNYVDFDEYVGLKLEKTRSTIRTTDLLTALAGVAAMFLGYLLIFVALDQWIVPGGFGVVWRWILLSTLVVSTTAWLVWKIGIPSFRTVNGLFAAQEIEKAEPELKSNLLNLVDIKAAGREVNPVILKSMERQAAVRLQQIDVSQAIDHRPLIHTAYVLLAVIVLFCFYALLSPKKISNSIWRSLLPAAQVPLATITEIVDVKPGDVVVPAHQPFVDVQVDLAGEIPAQVWLLYTTADGKLDQPIELRTDQEGLTRYKGQLIGDGGQGLMQDLTYYIRAGDAVSQKYKITVEQPPYAEIEGVSIDFPGYMKLQSIEQKNNGAIDAWEGATVVVTAKTNMPVRSGTIQFLDDSQAGPNGEEVAMSISGGGSRLQAQWTLALRSDGSFPKYYRIHCRTDDGRVTTGHVMNPLTIRPDLPPEVVLLQPDRDSDAPANAVVPLLIQARDPDFELSYIYLNVERAGQLVLHEILSEGRQSKLTLKRELELSKLNAVIGETIEFWIEVYDNKQPRPNSKNSPKVKIHVVPPVSQKEVEKQLADQNLQRDQKLAEADQEMNQDRSETPSSPEGEAKDRQSRETAMPQDTEPNQTENSNDASSQNGQQGSQQSNNQTPADKNQQKSGGQNVSGQSNSTEKSGESKDQSEASKGQSGNSSKSNKPLKNDGTDDDEIIRRINDKLAKNSPPKDNKTNENSPSDNSKTNKQQKENTQQEPATQNPKNDSREEPGNPPNPDKPKSAPNRQQNTEREKEAMGRDESANSQSDTAEAAKLSPNDSIKDPAIKGEANPEKKPRLGDKEDPVRENSDSPRKDQGEIPNPDKTTTDQKNSNSKPQDNQPKEGTSPLTPDEKAGMPDRSSEKNSEDPGEKQTPKESAGQTPPKEKDRMSETAENDKQEGSKLGQTPEQKPGDQQSAAETDKNDAQKSAAPTNENLPSGMNEQSPKQGATGKNDPSKKKDGATDTESKGNGPKEQVADSPDARKSDADGSEKGTGKPERDPKNKSSSAKNDNVKRDPNQKPETQPGESKSEPSQSENRGKKPKSSTPKNGTREEQPPQSGEKSPDKMEGDGGDSKPDKDGNSDNKSSGSGKDSKQPGSGKPSDESNGSANPQKSQGTGSEKSESAKGGDQADSPSEQSSDNKDGDNAESTGEKASRDKSSAEKNSGEKSSSEKKANDPNSKSDQSGKPKNADPKSQQKSSDKGSEKPESSDSGKESSNKNETGKGESGKEKGDGKGEGQGEGEGKGGKPSSKPGQSNGKPGDGGAPAQGDSVQSSGGDTSEGIKSEEANLEYNRQATELILQKLKKDLERGETDPELLEQLGWNQTEMKKFADRISKSLSESKLTEETAESKARQQQFQEMLKNLDLQRSGAKRTGENEPKRDVNQVESRRNPAPAAYRSVFEKYTKELARQKTMAGEKSSK